MRADRLLSIVLLLQRHHQLTAKALSDSLGVTERTIYRDIEALSMSGVPVYTRTGPDGGCFLDDTYRTSLNWFTGAELQTLLYTGTASPLSELGMDTTADNAILKLLALLPNHHQQQVEQMQQRLYLDPSGWYDSDETHPMLPKIKEAVWNDRVMDAQYENWEGDGKAVTLHPYSLVYKSGRWYLVARRDDKDTMRTYRVSRFTEVRLQLRTFERDSSFNIATYWADASMQFQQRLPEFTVTLRVKKHTLIYFQHMMAERYTVIEQSDTWWVLDVQYMVFEEARTSVLGLGTDVEVIAPQTLLTAVIEQAKAIVAKYDTSAAH